jgi:hypothetical protein
MGSRSCGTRQHTPNVWTFREVQQSGPARFIDPSRKVLAVVQPKS